jgi:hypothetical protein
VVAASVAVIASSLGVIMLASVAVVSGNWPWSSPPDVASEFFDPHPEAAKQRANNPAEARPILMFFFSNASRPALASYCRHQLRWGAALS